MTSPEHPAIPSKDEEQTEEKSRAREKPSSQHGNQFRTSHLHGDVESFVHVMQGWIVPDIV
jgi:hypothetical protein